MNKTRILEYLTALNEHIDEVEAFMNVELVAGTDKSMLDELDNMIADSKTRRRQLKTLIYN